MIYTKLVKKWLFSGLLVLSDGVGGFLSPARCHCHYIFKADTSLIIHFSFTQHSSPKIMILEHLKVCELIQYSVQNHSGLTRTNILGGEGGLLTDSLGSTGWEDKEVELPFTWQNSWKAWSSARGWMRSQLTPCGWGLKRGKGWSVFSLGCLTRKHKWIGPSTREPDETLYRKKQLHVWRPWSSRGISTSPVSAEGTAQQRFLECSRNFLIQVKTKRSDLDVTFTCWGREGSSQPWLQWPRVSGVQRSLPT